MAVALNYRSLFTPQATAERADRLRRKIGFCAGRIKEIDLDLGIHGVGDFKAQELRTERAELLAAKRIAEDGLAQIEAPPPSPEAGDPTFPERMKQYERKVAAEYRERYAASMKFIRKLEAEGEFNQSRIHRLDLLNLDDQIRREIPPPSPTRST